ncbi:hypothetical protein FVEG_11705 [Fusarium verticillioides 7600]|uniref:Nephrocystin 3-like N-terminal domain-containing protein n=1 Tax=Gibberella moniliformis (strain M3125 / FGSC 7600) TaxID=334819 RepID=W7MQ59_GIBM7|nr:hypothetical protein FVEG_11705 [Fusarium verticillioides 7600]EWG53231.1 hypothetical protein FVEG_11705 [Fusarium verticillioides 7600]
MDAQGSSSTRGKSSPEAIPATGLSIVYEPETDAPIVDIVFVHGLKGHPYKTWRCKQNPEKVGEPPADSGKEAPKSNTSKRLELKQSLKALLKGSSNNNRQGTSLTESTRNIPSTVETGEMPIFWPADLLPQICKKARIMTFGYDTKITKFTSGPTNTNSIFSHGKDFLFSLGREYVPRRPMIFVAYSLGGILVKEMIALSSNSDTLAHKGIIESTAAIVFLGTPHRGSPELSAIGEWARSMLSSLKFQTTSTILDTLGLKTTDLERAHEAFCRLWYQYDFQVKTFQESFGLTGIDLGVLGNKVVPHDSSLIGNPREHAETLQANHKQMSRFGTDQDPNYIKVAGEIKTFYMAIDNAHSRQRDLAEAARVSNMEASKNKKSPSEDTSPDILDQRELDDFLAALRFNGMNNRRDSILTPAVDTVQWLFQNQRFRLWTNTTDKRQRLLFIKGKPGAGKSTLMKEAVRYMQGTARKDHIVASFFIDAGGDTMQRCTTGIYRSLLYQLLLQSMICSPLVQTSTERQILICSIKDAIIHTVHTSAEWSGGLLEILLSETLDFLASRGKPVFIFVDALDELSIDMQRRQVDFWSLGHNIFDTRGPRICLSCRQFPSISVVGSLELVLDIHNQTDILNYIKQRLDTRISVHEGHWRKILTDKIHSLSSGVFLWVVLVVDETLASYDQGTSLLGLVLRIEEMPTELEKMYEKILRTAIYGSPSVIRKMFQWVLAASRPLRLDEWHHILAFIQPARPASLATWRNSEYYTENDDQLERKIKNLSKGLLEVSNKQHDVLAAEKNYEVSSINAGAGSLDYDVGSARVVRVIHQSVYDYFINKGGFRTLGLLESVDPLADCHCTILETCIDYLFIPELDEYIAARQRAADMASLVTGSLCSEKSFTTGGFPQPDDQGIPRLRRETFIKDWEAFLPRESFEVVENWLAGWTLSTYAGSITGSEKHSASGEPVVAAASQVLSDYVPLLVYAVTEFMLHIEGAQLESNPTQQKQDLITRLRDEAISERLRPLHQEKRSQEMIAQWLEAIAQNRLPSLPNPGEWSESSKKYSELQLGE